MNFFESEHQSIVKRRKHYQRDRYTCKAKGSGIDIQKLKMKIQQNPPSRLQIDRVLYFDQEQ